MATSSAFDATAAAPCSTYTPLSCRQNCSMRGMMAASMEPVMMFENMWERGREGGKVYRNVMQRAEVWLRHVVHMQHHHNLHTQHNT